MWRKSDTVSTTRVSSSKPTGSNTLKSKALPKARCEAQRRSQICALYSYGRLTRVDTAEYLDRRQNLPRHPRLIPEGSHALQAAFRDTDSAHMPFLAPTDVTVSNPASSVFLQTKFERMLGMKSEDVYPKDEAKVAAWSKWKAEVSTVSAWHGSGRISG
ncbi:hypothetical protein BT96DRAFT_345792 [Gymnopus androsaceus JB14]|uniref:Glutathione S-transferase UstS-like C-terminal domain-containing protein n=1 Tax=Gymnopus androsaceus JB14 TaxID=1447944 RepID=A0A6A4I3X4_9AGAR|nr:hypothetical protein BT96DRAFT_345792 [Gymnopus androsaceus JB14]